VTSLPPLFLTLAIKVSFWSHTTTQASRTAPVTLAASRSYKVSCEAGIMKRMCTHECMHACIDQSLSPVMVGADGWVI